MANILTPEQRHTLDRTMRTRFVMLLGIVLLVGALVALLALAPAYISVRVAQAAIESESLEAPADVKEDQDISARTSALIQALTPVVQATTTPSGAVLAVTALTPPGLRIQSLNYTPGTLSISGEAPRRELLNEYRQALEASGLFSSVNVPVAALVGAQEGKFTITIKGAF